MPYATTSDKVRLYYEEVGQGVPVLFVHEFASDYRGWEPQMREFGKRYRCITYSARGYAPSDVPADTAVYSYQHVMRDAVAVLDHLKIDRAHIVGLSMGGYTTLQVALNHPARVRSITLAGTGSGSERWFTEAFHKNSRELGDQFERDGSAAVAKTYGNGPSRVPFAIKDARGFAELSRFGRAFGAQPATLMGLSGLGDLVLTCNSAQSRNFSLGLALGRGVSLASLLAEGPLAEGVHTCGVLVDLAHRREIEMPIATAVDAVLAERLDIDAAIEALLARPQKAETALAEEFGDG